MDSIIHTKIGRLYVQKLLHREGYNRFYKCVCDCGKEVEKSSVNLVQSRKARTGSCGCLKSEMLVKRNTTHGKYSLPEHRVWATMRNRCSNPNYEEYHLYGGRGIKCSKSWLLFENFYVDMGPRPTPKHQLDRKNNEKGYEKGNCFWVTAKQNQRNRRDTLMVIFKGVEMPLAELADKAKIDYHAAYWRHFRGWSPEKIFSTPSRKQKAKL